MEHFYDALTEGKADAALAASLFHYKELEIREVKEYLDLPFSQCAEYKQLLLIL